MDQDAQLLLRYANERAEDAFAELVRRHLDLVYAAALRQLGDDSHTASDVSQLVFAELARQANSLAHHPSLPGWLYTTTRRMALHRIRTETRRVVRERHAYAMQEADRGPDSSAGQPDLAQLRSVLDDAMHELNEKDRQVLLVRYFEQQPLAHVGSGLGLGENAARMRVARALEKLRAQLARRGVVSSSTALAACLPECVAGTAPAGLSAAIVSGASLAGGASTATALTLITLMSTKTKIAITAALLLIAAGSLEFYNYFELRRLRTENAALREAAAHSAQTATPTPPAEPGLNEADRLEVVRLRGEVARLRKMPGKTRPAANASLPPSASPSTAKRGGVDATTQATIPPEQTLLTGGWSLVPGKRTLVFLTPTLETLASGETSVLLRPTTLMISEEAMATYNLQDLRSEEGQSPGQRLMGTMDVKQMLEKLAKEPGVEILTSPMISTLAGRQAAVGVTSDDSPNSLSFDMIPEIGADGRSVDLQLHTQIAPIEPRKTP
ncbi:MAG TPA: sigma-70 family RNA polymerase sigma factor [Candidatus Limnocylindria bacterium]|nr:sigma-70 family RNA polymerase sigma factor [Candidatus Limnocylindria bacterium]